MPDEYALAYDEPMFGNVIEENHFLRGERTLTLTDVRLAKKYGPILVKLAEIQKERSFRQFLNIAKKLHAKDPLIADAIPVTTGRRFEAFRLYLRFYDLADPSSWITDKAGQNSDAYKKDFNLAQMRFKSSNENWKPFIPGMGNRRVPKYSLFFNELKAYAGLKYQKRTLPALRRSLAKLEITRTAEVYNDFLPPEAQSNFGVFVLPYVKALVNDIADGMNPLDAFEKHIPNFHKK